MTFAQDITAFAKRTGLTGTLVMRKLGLQAFTGVLTRSPVDTGRFRASNRISANGPDLSVEPPVVGDSEIAAKQPQGAPMSASETARALRPLAQLRWGDSIHITNALPYAQPLEDGWSTQAPGPKGIYGATFAELRGSLAASIAASKAEAERGGAT